MPSETPFRLTLLVLISITMAIAVYHRYQAAASGERISHKEEGYLFAIMLRLVGVCLWITTFAYLLVPTSVQWASVPLPLWIRWLAAVTGGFCSVFMYWTLRSLGGNLTDTVVTRANATLVTRGAYRWVRHPFYVTTGMLMASVTLLTANWLIGVTSFLVLALLSVRTPKEEQMLLDRFGEDYRRYMTTTGRFFPRFPR